MLEQEEEKEEEEEEDFNDEDRRAPFEDRSFMGEAPPTEWEADSFCPAVCEIDTLGVERKPWSSRFAGREGV